MDTKSKNDRTLLWSMVAILFALISIGYCFSHIVELIGNGFERSSRMIAFFAEIIKGGTV